MDNTTMQQLMNFYSVDTIEALVEAQCSHVERLQEKLKELSPEPSFKPQRLREG